MTSLRKRIVSLGVGALGILALVLGLAAPVRPALAEPQASDRARLQGLIDELEEQLERGERERLNDPWFLRELRRTIGRYDNPWSRPLFSDDFSGRAPEPAPPWRVTAGEFLIDWRYGLRSVIEGRPGAEQDPAVTEEEAVKRLFGEILKQAIEGEGAAPAPRAASFAAVIASVKITNAFALRLELTARALEGVTDPRFEFGPYQGEAAAAGYRLAYRSGDRPSLELNSISPRGTVSTVEIYGDPLELEDGQVHVIEWTRDPAGLMIVKLDGKELMNVTDRRFRDPFDGFAVVNSGGDYALRSVTITGTE